MRIVARLGDGLLGLIVPGVEVNAAAAANWWCDRCAGAYVRKCTTYTTGGYWCYPCSLSPCG
jgi:hypothetical protein